MTKEEIIASANKSINDADMMLKEYRVDYLKVISRGTDTTTEYVLTGINSVLNKDFSSRFVLGVSDCDKEMSKLHIIFSNQVDKPNPISLESIPFKHSLENFELLNEPIKVWKNNHYEYTFAVSKVNKIIRKKTILTNKHIFSKKEICTKTYNGRIYYLEHLGNGYPNNVYCVKENFWRKEQIIHWLTKTGEFSTTGMIALINENGIIDVIIDEDMKLYSNEKRCCKVLPIADKLPEYIKFGTVEGNFYYMNTGWNSVKNRESGYKGGLVEPHDILTLDGCPETVTGMFHCEKIGLTSLKGCPKKVEGDFIAKSNKLSSFVGMPNYIGGCFNIANNEFDDASWEYAKENIDGEFCDYNISNNRFIKYHKELY